MDFGGNINGCGNVLMAAKGKYSKAIVRKIYDLKKTGEYTDVAICDAVGICQDTFYAWKKDDSKPEFSEMLKRAEEEAFNAIGQIARNSLSKKLKGYDYDETTTEARKDARGRIVARHIKSVKKHIPPSDTCIIFTLKNTDPDVFKDRIDHSGVIKNINVDWKDAIKNLSDEELEALDAITAKLSQ